MEKEIQNNDLKKATTKNTTLPKTLKISCRTLHNLFNECLITGNFSDNFKLADITLVFNKKKQVFLNKENYRPVSALPGISSISNNWLYKQFFVSLLMRLLERF